MMLAQNYTVLKYQYACLDYFVRYINTGNDQFREVR